MCVFMDTVHICLHIHTYTDIKVFWCLMSEDTSYYWNVYPTGEMTVVIKAEQKKVIQ